MLLLTENGALLRVVPTCSHHVQMGAFIMVAGLYASIVSIIDGTRTSIRHESIFSTTFQDTVMGDSLPRFHAPAEH